MKCLVDYPDIEAEAQIVKNVIEENSQLSITCFFIGFCPYTFSCKVYVFLSLFKSFSVASELGAFF